MLLELAVGRVLGSADRPGAGGRTEAPSTTSIVTITTAAAVAPAKTCRTSIPCQRRNVGCQRCRPVTRDHRRAVPTSASAGPG